MQKSGLESLLLFSLAVLFPGVGFGQTYSITELEPAPGSANNNSSAFRVSDSGHVVGYANLPEGWNQACAWQAGNPNPPVILGALGGNYSSARSINSLAQVAGWADQGFGLPTVPFIWLPSPAYNRPQGMSPLGDLGGSGSLPTVGGISNSGHVVGGSTAPDGRAHAFVWAPSPSCGLSQGMNDLNNLIPFGGWESRAHDINDSNQIVGTTRDPSPSFQNHAFLWDCGQATDLSPGSSGVAHGINNLGQVVGSVFPGGSRAFVWLPEPAYGRGAGLHDLGTLPGFTESVAFDINDSGEVVGRRGISPGGPLMLWRLSESFTPIDMSTLLPPGSGWQLDSPGDHWNGINNAGQIAGRGLHDGETRAYLITPEVVDDTTRPVIEAIDSPQEKTIVDTSPRTILGRAKDDGGSGLSLVAARVNGGSWIVATGTVSWSVSLPLSLEFNQVEVLARDNAGNISDSEFVSITYNPSIASFVTPVDNRLCANNGYAKFRQGANDGLGGYHTGLDLVNGRRGPTINERYEQRFEPVRSVADGTVSKIFGLEIGGNNLRHRVSS